VINYLVDFSLECFYDDD